MKASPTNGCFGLVTETCVAAVRRVCPHNHKEWWKVPGVGLLPKSEFVVSNKVTSRQCDRNELHHKSLAKSFAIYTSKVASPTLVNKRLRVPAMTNQTAELMNQANRLTNSTSQKPKTNTVK